MALPVLPPELLHIIVQSVAGQFLASVLIGPLKYTPWPQDELRKQAITSYAMNPLASLLGTSSQIRHITLRVVSDALRIPLDSESTVIARCEVMIPRFAANTDAR